MKVLLKSLGLFNMWLLMFISFNLPWGVESDERRRLQIRECMRRT